MRRTVCLLLLLWSLSAVAQRNLSGSRQSSAFTYIYRVTPKEAGLLYKSNMEKLQEKHLHTKVDSFKTNWIEPELKPGNYLFIQAAGNKFDGEIRTVDDLQIKLLNNDRDLLIAVHDKTGQSITDIQVFAGGKKMPYDKNFHAFRLNKERKARTIKVYHQDILHYFPLNNDRQISFWNKLSYSFPLKYAIQPIRRLINGTHRYRRRYYYNSGTPYEKKFSGFMVFSKPRYKPGDTVKLKAWVATRKGKPVNRPLLLRLTANNFGTDTILATITPYRPGGYEYSFVLKDSLDLTLDWEHLLTLEELSSRKYDLDKYDGDLSNNDYVVKRPILMRGRFGYEEYELGSITFNARSDKKEHNRGNPLALYCKAIDENEMAVMDGRVELLVKPRGYGAKKFTSPEVFLPDTLWSYTQPLESIGETKIMIPDSIFPAVSFDYDIVCTFLNSNNEQKTSTLQQHFYDERKRFIFDRQNDSLHISLTEAGKSILAGGILYTSADRDGDQVIKEDSIQLPATIHIDPYVKLYGIEVDSLNQDYVPEQDQDIISCRSYRTRDSVMIQVVNPQHLTFWYTIYAGNKVIQRGYADSLLFLDKARTLKNYFISLQYIYANTSMRGGYSIPYRDKALNIQVKQPGQVYPGQQVKVDIAVTDTEGKPVQDADVTAYAFTKKFANTYSPHIPYYGKTYRGPKSYNQFFSRELDIDDGSIKLNWQRWSREMGLDTIEYYRFLHPDTIYTNTEKINHDLTQIAPFVVLDGELQPVHLLYIDEVPYFFSQAQQLQQYSFAVRPGKHALKIRTADRLIHIDSIWAMEGMKTFISIDADIANKAIRQQKMPAILTDQESILWSKYMILIENNFGEKLATIEQNNQFTILNLVDKLRRQKGSNQLLLGFRDQYSVAQAPSGRERYSSILVGPLPTTGALLHVKDKFDQEFQYEGNYIFNISKGLIKQKQLPYSNYPFKTFLSRETTTPSFKDYVFTAADVDSLWQYYLDHRNATENLFRNQALNKTGNGQLEIGSPTDTSGRPVFVESVILFRYDDPDFARIYNGNTWDLGYVQPGMYRLMLLLKGDQYFIKDSVRIKKDGINYYDPGTIVPRQQDSTSVRIAAIINNRESGWHSYHQAEDLDAIKTTFNNQYLNSSIYTKRIYGRVTDRKTGEPIVGVTIMIKGTSSGTVTDIQGYFELNVPERGTIVANFVGYTSVAKKITVESNYDIIMSANETALEEVVVVGYGTQRKMSVTGSVASVTTRELQGRVSGVRISDIVFTGEDTSTPLVIVDGIPYQGDWNNMDKELIGEVNVLKDAVATAIYGSRAAAGVIVITTKKGAQLAKALAEEMASPQAGNTLRTNFHDHAFWQPALRTDQQGKTSFTTTYPDDITSWRTYVIAMSNDKRTGIAENIVRAFKALTGSIALPQFAVAGDSIQVIGKTMNYSPDSLTVNRTFSINSVQQQETAIGVRNAHIDSFQVVVTQQDSMKFKYTIQKTDGYFDGEERSIPVFKQGVQETKGFFTTLEQDTSFTLQPDAGLGNMTIHAETSVLPVLLDEIESLRNYEYLCNEQVASKLKALLLKKKVYGYLEKEFKEEKNIRELITRLQQSKTQGLLWGWWSNNTPVLWISQHVTEALLMAEQQKYTVQLNKQGIIDYLVLNFDQYNRMERINAVRLLQLLDSKADYKRYIDSLEKNLAKANLYEKLQVLQLKQQAGLPVQLDTFITKQQHTMMGNPWWGEENDKYHFFYNTVQNTLAMYQLLKRAGNQEQLLSKIRHYFLEKRKDGKWRNTFESSLILETILPDLLTKEATMQPASLTITGQQQKQINTFPYTTTIPATEKLTITKQKGMPVYFTAYQQNWNPAPPKVAGDFIVESSFEHNSQPKTTLKAGEAVTLKVKVTVKADADYVMVEVPIPAGCSYKDKNQSWQNNEVHREYFKNKVSIFSSSLPKGEYTFTVSLLPRYTGSYHLNPAKAEMMYFPVFYGREEMKKINIR